MNNTISYQFSKDKLASIKSKVLYWLKAYSTFAYLDNNLYQHAPNKYELLVGVEANKIIGINEFDACLDQWKFGFISYDYKNEIEPNLSSNLTDFQQAPNLKFFIPNFVIYIPFDGNELIIESNDDCETILKAILSTNVSFPNELPRLDWQPLINYENYQKAINRILQHIVNGDCYELNYCSGQIASAECINSIDVFYKLNQINSAPFATCICIDEIAIISASPERFLYRNEEVLLAQPIKGTIKRDLQNIETDEQLKKSLRSNIKEQAENVMIVDLMRNDLAKVSETGSVHVPELFGVYSFPFVHHLISTIQSKIKSGISFKEILHATFPMGSMTGAPKYIVMELIEQYEMAKRGIFSGSIGYIDPKGNFDFNVVIRSLIYNTKTKTISFYTGGAITIDSIPEKEYDELLLKASGLTSIFNA